MKNQILTGAAQLLNLYPKSKLASGDLGSLEQDIGIIQSDFAIGGVRGRFLSRRLEEEMMGVLKGNRKAGETSNAE